MTTPGILWQTKVAARLHDPAEKALVLLRDPVGHEGGSSKVLQRLLGLQDIEADLVESLGDDTALVHALFPNGVKKQLYRHVQRADWWAAAADRPQWPSREITVVKKKDGSTIDIKIAEGSQVRWSNAPVLIHPLSGQTIDLKSLSETEIGDIKQCTFDHVSDILVKLNRASDGERDWKKILLILWRFAPNVSETKDNSTIGELWKLLPADTRVPDHSIWDHLDVTSAFAGAFAADAEQDAALLSLSIGPVQKFIAAARSTSDLWAGSHLLSRLSWEAMRPICEEFGPDAILFPRLRGVAQVDLWLKEQGIPAELFKDEPWNEGATDNNPLFSAALPNRLVAVVPTSQVKAIAKRCEASVRDWLLSLGQTVVDELLMAAGIDDHSDLPIHLQMRDQLGEFPEVHWSAVPFSLIKPRDEKMQRDLDVSELQSAMAPFYGTQPEVAAGFLASPAWHVLKQDVRWDDRTAFFMPNPGVLYPAIYDLSERMLAATKALRPFKAIGAEGWRCSLSGETEWLTTDRAHLSLSQGQRSDTLWTSLRKQKPSWVKKGEHLGALPAIKRLWPTIFAEEVASAIGKDKVSRFVVSTHTMALAHQMENALNHSRAPLKMSVGLDHAALPRRLMQIAKSREQRELLTTLQSLPTLMDEAAESEDDAEMQRARKMVQEALGVEKIENYYAVLMLDGDKLGQILSGAGKHGISYLESFHPKLRKGVEKHAQFNSAIAQYVGQRRAISPSSHLAISGALNDFSQIVVRHIIESEFLGRLIYSGGDDVLALLPVADLFACMARLRQAYSGDDPNHQPEDVTAGERGQLRLKNGFAMLNGRLMRMMGNTATASCGAVIAHHQMPLNIALREVRAAEKRAKDQGGRDAFSVKVLKRAGGELSFTSPWSRMDLLQASINFLRKPEVSRRAVYHVAEWLRDLPDPTAENKEMIAQLLRYQFNRQSQKKHCDEVDSLVTQLIELIVIPSNQKVSGSTSAKERLANFLSIAEFLARESRLDTVLEQTGALA